MPPLTPMSLSLYKAINPTSVWVPNHSREMRFLGFITCGRRAMLLGDAPPSPRRPEEAAPLSPMATQDKLRHRAAPQGASPMWRPSLGAISEDGVQSKAVAMVVLPRSTSSSVAAAKGGERLVRSRSTSAGFATAGAPNTGNRLPRSRSTNDNSAGRVPTRADRGAVRHLRVPSIMPAFAPMAFTF